MPHSIAATKPSVILVIGDSISSGYGLANESGWVDLLNERLKQQQLQWIVENASITGETTRGGLQRLPDLLKLYQPQIVIIELGGNDGLRGFKTAQTRYNLQQMVEISRQNQADVLLLGVRLPVNYGKKYRQQFEQIFIDLGQQSAIRSIPRFMLGVADNLDLMQADGIHPSASAQKYLLENTWPELLAMITTNNKSPEPKND